MKHKTLKMKYIDLYCMVSTSLYTQWTQSPCPHYSLLPSCSHSVLSPTPSTSPPNLVQVIAQLIELGTGPKEVLLRSPFIVQIWSSKHVIMCTSGFCLLGFGLFGEGLYG